MSGVFEVRYLNRGFESKVSNIPTKRSPENNTNEAATGIKLISERVGRK